MSVAIITGASSGLGSEFCRALDRMGYDELWLVARRADRLAAMSEELGTESRTIVADLSVDEGLDALFEEIRASSPDIGCLVNCAGMGRFGSTDRIPQEDTRMMISLNVEALARITSFCIPFMGRGSSIIQVCSASAYLPLPELNVYSASKSFVRSFCNGLRPELRSREISVLEVSPGWIETDFIPLSVSDSDVPEGVFRHTVTKEDVVSRAMRDLSKGRRRSVCGSYNRLQVFVCTHLPSLATRVWMSSLRVKG